MEPEKDTHSNRTKGHFEPLICRWQSGDGNNKFGLIFTAIFFVYMISICGCISISDQGLTIAFSYPDEKKTAFSDPPEEDREAHDNHQTENEITSDNKRVKEQDNGPDETAYSSPVQRKLNIDHWRSMPIWPKPIAGVAAVRSIQRVPLFRWQHQGFINIPVPSPEDQSINPTTELDAEKTAAANGAPDIGIDQKHEIHPQVVAELQQLANRDDLSGWNATIMLARQIPQSLTSSQYARLKELTLEKIEYETTSGKRSLDRLESDQKDAESSEVKPLSDSMQAAAAEAWCYALAQQPGDASENFAEAGRALQKQLISDAVRIELMRGITRKIKPRLVPSLNRQMAESELQQGITSSLTMAALDACICYAIYHPQQVQKNQTGKIEPVISFDAENLDPQKLWPENIWNLRWHQDHQLVNRLGMWLALTEHPVAQSYLSRRLTHVERSVEYHAIRNLGLLHSETALEKLREIVESRPGTPRAIGLLAIGDRDEDLIFRYLRDESSVVRLAIAHYAAQHISVASARVLQEFTHDEDLKIQQATVSAIDAWPNEKAFSVLSAAFTSGGVSARNMARKQLEQRFGIVMTVMQDDEADREQILDTISRKFQLASHANNTLFDESPHKNIDDQTQQKQVSAQLQKLLDQLSQKQEVSFNKNHISRKVTALIKQSPNGLNDVLNKYGLKQLEQTLKQLDSLGISEAREIVQLSDDRLSQRRRAARALAEQAKTKTLSNWKLRLIAERLKQEQDLHICRDLMVTIDQDTTQEARVVAQNALIHTWPDVRILGCQYVQKQRIPQLAPFLLPLLQERNTSVQQAAIIASGYCQNPLVIDGFSDGTDSRQAGLRSLLGKVNRETELLVIAGLARLGDEQGRSELFKLSYSSDTQTRRQVVRIMGELQDPKLVKHLIRIGWTEPVADIRLAVLDALKQTVPVKQQPRIIASETTQQKMQIWSDWLDEQSETVSVIR